MGAPLMEDDVLDDPTCQWCGRRMYRHPIIIYALICLRCDRPR